ncbi:MAG TPA: HAD family hydrolase [Aeromonadales bacterium]|nr:HAD family hydrolase [Aeromonadales bacterium]
MTFKGHIKIISLDLDDTLWDNQIVIDRAKNKLYEKILENYPNVAHFFDFYSFEQLAHQLYQEDTFKCNWSALRLVHITEILKKSGYSTEHALALSDYYYFWRNRVDLFPGVEQVLSYLASRYQLISLTNGNASINEIGIGQYFQFSICAADVGEKKPSARLYKEVLNKTGVKAEQIVHIGNHIIEDVQAALASGMQAIWFNPEHESVPEDITEQTFLQIERIEQLMDIL